VKRIALLLLGAVVLLPAGLENGGAASSAHPGKNGRVAFVRVVAGPSPGGVPLGRHAQIYTVAPDGTGARALTSGVDYQPSWSPEGSRLAFSRNTDPTGTGLGSWEIFVVDARGSAVQRLTTSAVDERSPTWSPDGSRLAFEANGAIWTMRDDGRQRRLLVRDARAPAWSPDGRWIAYVTGGSSIELIRPDGKRHRRIARSAYYGDSFGLGEAVEWTPDGRIAFVGGDFVVRSRATDGSRRQRVGSGRDPAWSPDGQWLAVTVWSSTDPYADRLDLVSADGLRRWPLTESLYPVQDFQPDWQPVCDWRGGPARDVIDGTSRDELLCGDGGSDVVIGGDGRDRLFGEAGGDRILARDGAFDVVGCGSGFDTVLADPVDLVGADCERVLR
jgi:Tol biopolymer transport system component